MINILNLINTALIIVNYYTSEYSYWSVHALLSNQSNEKLFEMGAIFGILNDKHTYFN